MNARLLAAFAFVTLAVAAGVVAFDRSTEKDAPYAAATREAPAPSHAVAAAEARPSSPAVTAGFRAAGLTINTPVHTGAEPGSDDGFGVELAFFGSFSRTSLAIEYRHEAGGMLDIDNEASSLTRFTDDRGTDLTNEEAPFGPFDTMARVAEDGRHLVFVVPSDTLPATGATSVTASGTLAVRCATQKEEITSDVLALGKGVTIAVGGYELRVQDIGPSQWGEGHALTLESKRELGAIESWALISADGTRIEASPSMSMSGMGTWTQTLELDRPVERASLRITRWTDLRTVQVPFEVEAGLGLR